MSLVDIFFFSLFVFSDVVVLLIHEAVPRLLVVESQDRVTRPSPHVHHDAEGGVDVFFFTNDAEGGVDVFFFTYCHPAGGRGS